MFQLNCSHHHGDSWSLVIWWTPILVFCCNSFYYNTNKLLYLFIKLFREICWASLFKNPIRSPLFGLDNIPRSYDANFSRSYWLNISQLRKQLCPDSLVMRTVKCEPGTLQDMIVCTKLYWSHSNIDSTSGIYRDRNGKEGRRSKRGDQTELGKLNIYQISHIFNDYDYTTL